MTRDEVLAIYSARYAATYDDTFLHAEHYEEATAFELAWLREHMPPGGTWLDAACGTGWFLSQFPDVDRCGLDLSPAMLDIARSHNPQVSFYEADFREPQPHLESRCDFVSLMWWAYCYAGSVPAIRKVIANVAAWTKRRLAEHRVRRSPSCPATAGSRRSADRKASAGRPRARS